MMTFLIPKKWLEGHLPPYATMVTTPDEIGRRFPMLKEWMDRVMEDTWLDYDDEIRIFCDETLIPEAVCAVDWDDRSGSSMYPQ